jgi:hypothetical protein
MNVISDDIKAKVRTTGAGCVSAKRRAVVNDGEIFFLLCFFGNVQQQLLNKREEELMLREEYIRRKETALEELKKRENELEEKLQRFVGDQSALRTQVEAQSGTPETSHYL